MIKVNQQPLPHGSQSSGNLPEILRDTRNFYDLLPGERFKALITDIKPGLVTIRLDGGGTFTARTMLLPEARIGEESVFTVRENNQKGQILLEMVKPSQDIRQVNMVREALINAGMLVNDESIALGKALVAKSLPVDAQTLQKAVFFRYAREDMTPEKAVFLLCENIPADINSIQLYTELLSNPQWLHKAINTLVEQLLNTNDAVLTQAFLTPEPDYHEDIQATGGNNPASISRTLHKRLSKLFFLQLKDNHPQASITDKEPVMHELNRYYNTLQRQLLNNEALLTEHGIKSEILDMLHCMEQITRHREYYQIPFMTEQDSTPRQAELFVFKDGKEQRDLNQQANVLLALDTLSLGRVEVYTQKEGKRVSLQFRCASEDTLHIIKHASHTLTRALKDKGFDVAAPRFEKAENAFTITDPAPGTDETQPPAVPKRFLFDMRV